MPSLYDIFDYWKDKCITEDGEVKIECGYDGYDGHDINRSIPVVYDWGEPECFACGYKPSLKDAEKYKDFKTLWNGVGRSGHLQRCHIVAKSLGGPDKADNLFCMCEICHISSPDTVYPEMFFRWVYERRQKGSLFEQAIRRGEKMGIPRIFFQPEDINTRTTTQHGGACVDASFIAAYLGGAKERFNKFKSERLDMWM